MEPYDVVVIGGGPGGYVAAIKARQIGLKTGLVEKESLGGVCLNWGCIPTKALLRNAEVIRTLGEGKAFGFSFDTSTLTVDYAAAQKRSRQVSGRLVKGVQFLMKKNEVDVIEGTGVLKSPNEVTVGEQTLSTKNIIIATGARPRPLSGVAIDGNLIISSREALEMTQLPESIIVVGAGAIGVEFASVWNAYGANVTLVEMLPTVLPLEDADIGAELEKALKKQKIAVLTGTRVDQVDTSGGKVTLAVSKDGATETLTADKALIAIGAIPNSEGIGLESIGIETDRGFVGIDEHMQSNVPGVYAIGDVTGKLALAHVASAQGMVAAEAIAGHETEALNYSKMPRCVYSHPEVASVGLSESEARKSGYEVQVGQFPFRANGKALGLNDYEGFVKIVSDGQYNEVLGVHIFGPHVTELIAGPTAMLRLEATLEEIAHTIHPHPTLSEAIMEAAHAAMGEAIHI
ncbi:MAG: dihydrolipoyl dehydrogenase [Ardenticatenia bacterium]|nr:dihydrolipoyl dehydrogenase [Ardenticatenia bacterium]